MDVLGAVRESVLSNSVESVEKLDNGQYYGVAGSVYPSSFLVPYKSQEGKGDFYTLDTVLFFAGKLAKGFTFGEYMRAAKEAGVETIKLVDRKHLENYLTGKTDASEFIVPDQLPAQEAGRATGKRSRDAHDGHLEQDDDDDGALTTILSNELRMRNRNTMLSIPGRSFDTVMDVLENVARDELQNAARANASVDAKSVTAPRSSGRFQRQTTTDAAMKQMGADALGIQNIGFGGMQQPAAQVEPIPMEKQKPAQLVVPRPMKKAPAPIKPKMTPLILVPPAAGAILNMHNIKEFLEKGIFVPPDEARAKNPTKPSYERCMRIEGRNPPGVKYHITDRDPTKKEDWDRLVAVFCLGKSWQFKKWPFKGASSGDMVDTFLKVAGVFFHYADEPVDPLIKKWNVKLIPIKRHSRDTDDAAMRAFWHHVDAFLKARNPNVVY